MLYFNHVSAMTKWSEIPKELYSFFFFFLKWKEKLFKERQTATSRASLGCVWGLGGLITLLLQTHLQSLCGGLSREAKLLRTPGGEPSSSTGEGGPLQPAPRTPEHGAEGEEGQAPASQVPRINAGDQWGDRYHSQTALTC